MYNLTPRQFHNRLNGWREIQDAGSLDAWRRTRTVSSYVLAIGQWKKNQAPDILKLMPLPGDPKPELPPPMPPEELARKRYKLKKLRLVRFNDGIEDMIRQHYRPDWGPHPDELIRKDI